MDLSTINRYICVILLTFICYRYAIGGFCQETYQNPHTCYRVVTYIKQCSNWGRRTLCTRYKTATYNCPITRSRQVCCAGFTGANCATPICTAGCPNGASCTAPDTCTCMSGFAPPSCAAICASGCPNGGTCTAPETCSCMLGFAPPSCTDIDECANLICSQTCTNTQGSYNCGCNPGYNLQPDGKTCLAGWVGCSCLCRISYHAPDDDDDDEEHLDDDDEEHLDDDDEDELDDDDEDELDDDDEGHLDDDDEDELDDDDEEHLDDDDDDDLDDYDEDGDDDIPRDIVESIVLYSCSPSIPHILIYAMCPLLITICDRYAYYHY